MKNAFLSLFFLLPGISFSGEGTSYNLDLQNHPTLKTIYDAGMRPWRVTNDHCMVGGQGDYSLHQVTLVFPESDPFTFPSEATSFSVFSDYELSEVNVKTVGLSSKDAKQLTSEICKALKFETKGLEEFFSSIDDKTRWSAFWTIDDERDDMRFHLLCRPSPRMNETLYQVTLSAEWRPGTAADRRKRMLLTPMQPPDGYQTISMAVPTPPPGQKPVPDPAYSFDAMKQKIEEYKKQQGK